MDQVRPVCVMTASLAGDLAAEIGPTDPGGSHDVGGPCADHEQKHDPREAEAFEEG
jgi:hypothetical protein